LSSTTHHFSLKKISRSSDVMSRFIRFPPRRRSHLRG
jgi:hypothetical protein